MSVRKNVSFKNGRVLNTINELPEGERSDFIEKCILYYLDSKEKEYVTEDQLNEILDDYNRKVCILNQNYTQMVGILEDISKELFK